MQSLFKKVIFGCALCASLSCSWLVPSQDSMSKIRTGIPRTDRLESELLKIIDPVGYEEALLKVTC